MALSFMRRLSRVDKEIANMFWYKILSGATVVPAGRNSGDAASGYDHDFYPL
jgi:hypothetical protein